MADDTNKQWAYTDLSEDRTIVLTIEGREYELAQFTASFARNEVPRATCLVAIGRNARTQEPAQIHKTGLALTQMKKAKVELRPRKEWRPRGGEEWEGSELIFEGYYTGLAYRKVSNRVQAVLHLSHWLIDLSFSSTLDKNAHPSNPTSLVAPAVTPQLGTGTSGAAVFVSHLTGHESIKTKVKDDLWHGIKAMLCALTEVEKMEIKCDKSGAGGGDKKSNTRAQEALKKIQGPGGDCSKDYDSEMGGLPLKLEDQGVPLVPEAVANSVTQQTLHNFAHTTFWDVITGVYGPMFNLAIIPQVEIATIIASTPALNQTYDKTLKPGEYDNFDLTGQLSRPLQGVGVYGDYETLTGFGKTETGKGEAVCVGGHFASDAENAGDGMWLVVRSPPWLRVVSSSGIYAGSSTGIVGNASNRSSTTPGSNAPQPSDPPPGKIFSPLRKLYNAYAHSVYVENMLRGRGANISGKLRFDIAPGSIIKLESVAEQFAGGEDNLAVDIYGHVVRVTININAEAQRAGTSFQLSHIRTETEFNGDDRTTVKAHPLFGADVYKGAPLVKNWKFPNA